MKSLVEKYPNEGVYRMPEEELFTAAMLIDLPGRLLDVAKLFINQNFTAEALRTLHYHKSEFYRWSGACRLCASRR